MGGRGDPSASAKRSAEQKCGIKIGGTKIDGTKIWWGTHGGRKNGGGTPPLGGKGDP